MSHIGRRPGADPDSDWAAGDPILDRPGYMHQARLLRALHAAEPVEYDGKHHFIHTVSAQQAGGQIEMTVYLTGAAQPVDSTAIQLRNRAEAQEESRQ